METNDKKDKNVIIYFKMDGTPEQHFVVISSQIVDTLTITNYRQAIANLSDKKPIDVSTIKINGLCHISETNDSKNAHLALRLGYVLSNKFDVPKEVQYKALNKKPTHLRLVK